MSISDLFGGGGSSKTGTNPFNFSNPFFNASMDKRGNSTAGATGGLLDFQNQSLANAGLFGGMTTNNQGADLASMLGMGLMGGASQFGPQGQFQGGPAFQGVDPFQFSGFDPNQLAMNQYNLGKSIISPDQQQAQLDMEQRLFSQGRLGSTGGGHTQNALFDAQGQQDNNLLFSSLDQGLRAQNQLFNQGLMAQGQNFNQGLAGYNANLNNLFNTRQLQNSEFGQRFGLGAQALQLDPTLRGLFQNMGSNELNNLLNIQNTGTNLFNAGAGASRFGEQNSGGNFSGGDLVKAGLLNAGVAGLTGGIGNLFTGAGGAGLGALFSGAGSTGAGGLTANSLWGMS